MNYNNFLIDFDKLSFPEVLLQNAKYVQSIIEKTSINATGNWLATSLTQFLLSSRDSVKTDSYLGYEAKKSKGVHSLTQIALKNKEYIRHLLENVRTLPLGCRSSCSCCGSCGCCCRSWRCSRSCTGSRNLCCGPGRYQPRRQWFFGCRGCLDWLTRIMNFHIFVSPWAGVTKNVAVNWNSTTRLAITPKMEGKNR